MHISGNRPNLSVLTVHADARIALHSLRRALLLQPQLEWSHIMRAQAGRLFDVDAGAAFAAAHTYFVQTTSRQ
eukprot:15484130-Alexandrium_andersonii.AAC.1